MPRIFALFDYSQGIEFVSSKNTVRASSRSVDLSVQADMYICLSTRFFPTQVYTLLFSQDNVQTH